MNTYKISLQLLSSEESESSSITRKEFVSAISNFIGDSRQEQQQPLTPLDSSSLTENSENSEPANPPDVITRSYPIHIHNISIKQFKLPQIDLSLTCSQGCNVSLLLEDIKQTLQEQLTRKIQFDSSVFRTAHCGITETSPLCVDKEWKQRDSITDSDIRASPTHTSVLPWYVVNDATMLRHFSVAYIESFRFVFYNSFTWRTVQSASSGSVHPHPNQSRIVWAVVVDIQYNCKTLETKI